jgi:hypothetical protein
MKRAPGPYKSGSTVKARAAAALVTDHKRKPVAACVPNFDFTDAISDTAELHGTPRMRPVLSGLIVESEQLNALSAGALPRTLHFGTDGRNAICTLRKLIKVTRKPIGAFIGEAPLAPLASDGRVALNLAAFDTERVVAGRG